MIRKHAACFFAFLLILPMARPEVEAAVERDAKDARLAQKVKVGIVKLGVGPEARVSVKLKDKTRLAGYVSEIGDDHFVVTDLHTAMATSIPYPDVAQVQGNNLTTKVKIIIATSIIVAVIVVLVIVRGAFCDGC